MNLISHHYRLNPGGGALKLQPDQRAVPQAGPGQVLLRIRAASLNYRDLLTQQDLGGTRAGLIPLSDGVGEVVALGEGVAAWQVGDRVSPNFFPALRGGTFNPADSAQALGGGATDGVLAEFCVFDQDALVAIPDHLSDAEAATLPCAALTAWHALFERGGLQAGHTVLVQGTGGVALFGLQLAVAQGARVIVTSSSDAKLARARELGAWQTINYRETPDWDQTALAFTEGRGVDRVLELGGPDTYDRSIAAVAPGGRIAQIGVLSGFNSRPNILPLQFKNASIDGICVGSVEQFKRLNEFVARHQIRPVIDQRFSFDEVPQAYEQLRSAQHFGKLVIELA